MGALVPEHDDPLLPELSASVAWTLHGVILLRDGQHRRATDQLVLNLREKLIDPLLSGFRVSEDPRALRLVEVTKGVHWKRVLWTTPQPADVLQRVIGQLSLVVAVVSALRWHARRPT